MVAQVGDPCAVAVAGREVHAVRCGDHLFQVALAVSQCLPQVQINAALAGGQLCQLLVHAAQHIRGKPRLLFRCRRPYRRDGLYINNAVLAQRLAQLVQHLAVVGQKTVGGAQGGQGVGAQQDIQLFGLRRCQHIQCHLLPAGGALDGGAVDDGVRPYTRIAADERAAQIDLVVREAHRQAVAQKGGVRKIAQVYLTAGRLPDNTGIIRLNGISTVGLPGRAEAFQLYRLRRAAAIGCTLAAAAGSRLALHGQRCQNVLCNAACAGLRGAVLFNGSFFQDGGHRIGDQQDGHNDSSQPQLAADAPARAPPGCRMILV